MAITNVLRYYKVTAHERPTAYSATEPLQFNIFGNVTRKERRHHDTACLLLIQAVCVHHLMPVKASA